MNDLEAQVERGQAALGRLVRQFLAVNDYKHVQFMQMAHALTGVRWLHSSQISTLKRGAAKNLTGFPLYSLALVNRRIWEVNAGTASAPPGTRQEDWLGKSPMVSGDGDPLDIGDLWRIYFGEVDAPFFDHREIIEVDDDLAGLICTKISTIFAERSGSLKTGQTEWLDQVMERNAVRTRDRMRLIKGVFLGVAEMDAAELTANVGVIAKMLYELTQKEFTEQQVYELCLDGIE